MKKIYSFERKVFPSYSEKMRGVVLSKNTDKINDLMTK